MLRNGTQVARYIQANGRTPAAEHLYKELTPAGKRECDHALLPRNREGRVCVNLADTLVVSGGCRCRHACERMV